jgi:hypothetical protein
MDSRNDILNSIIWEIDCGSLVKIKKYNFDGSTYYQHGVVVGKKHVNQLEMFPCIEVYTFETQSISKQAPSVLEVISKPFDEKDKTNLD